MKYLRYKQAELVSSVEEYNKAMKRLAEMNPVDDVQLNDGVFLAIIRYEVNEKIPETVRDEFRLQGLTYFCSQCPLHDDVTDKRRARVPCRYAEFGEAKLREECCEVFYRKLARGEIKIGGDEDEEVQD